MKRTPTCTWDGEHWTTPADTPCPDDHCAMRGHCPNHVNHAAGLNTCASCIGRTRRHVHAIVTLAALLPFDAAVDGLESEAMNLVGPAASPEQYAARRAHLDQRYTTTGLCDWPRLEAYQPTDPHHPFTVLAGIDGELRALGWLGDTDLLPTITSAATAIDTALNGPWPHGDDFADHAARIATCLAHLEAVDHNARTPDQGRPCPTCAAEHGTGPKLVKRHARHPGYRPGQTCPEKAKATEKAERRRGWCTLPRIIEPADCEICDGTLDAWHCPNNPAHAWTDTEYRNRLGTDYIQHADWLRDHDMQQRTGIKAGTVREWASRGHVAKRTHDGRVVYRVTDVQRTAREKGMMAS